MNNFKCENGHEFFISGYKMIVKPEGNLYYHKNTPISCPICNSIIVSAIDKEGDFSNIQLGKYTMRSIPERKEHLKKRSHEHFLKKIKDKKHEIDRDPTLQSLN